MKMKEKTEKVGLELNIQKTMYMASGPITSWQIHSKERKQWQTLFGGGASKITADGDCNNETKRHLILGRKVLTNPDSLLKAETLLCQQRSI